MKFKKLVLMGLLCCTLSTSGGMQALAAGADAETVKVQESAAAEKAADETGDFGEEDKETYVDIMAADVAEEDAAAEGKEEFESAEGAVIASEPEEADIYALTVDLSEEVANLETLLESSITTSLTATIQNEQAKLPELPSYTQDELMYLSCIIYCEAGSQTKKGKIAVANVIMNRVESKVFDHVNTIKEVIYDCNRWGRQFSPVYVKSNGKWTTKGSNYEKMLTMYKTGNYPKEWQKEQMQDCIEAAKEALTGKRVIDSSFLYFNGAISSGKAKCEKSGKPYTIIGCHIFY